MGVGMLPRPPLLPLLLQQRPRTMQPSPGQQHQDPQPRQWLQQRPRLPLFLTPLLRLIPCRLQQLCCLLLLPLALRWAPQYQEVRQLPFLLLASFVTPSHLLLPH